MIVLVDRYNSEGERIKIDRLVVDTVQIKEKVIILEGGELPTTQYIRVAPGEPIDILISEDEYAKS